MLVNPIILKESLLIKHFAYILNSVLIDYVMEIVFLYCLQIYIHVTVLAHCFNLLFLDTHNYVLEV